MTTVNIDELQAGPALDWLVSLAEGYMAGERDGKPVLKRRCAAAPSVEFIYDATQRDWYHRATQWSTDWAKLGPLIKPHQIDITSPSHPVITGVHDNEWYVQLQWSTDNKTVSYVEAYHPDDPMVAICRAIAKKHHGEAADVPAVLLEVTGG